MQLTVSTPTVHALPLWSHPRSERLAPRIDLRGLLGLMGGEPPSGADEHFVVQCVLCGHVLTHQGAPAQALFVVQAGSFKCIQTAEDGYEHVLAFASRGDLIGYDGLYGGHHHAFSAVALEDCRVVVLALPTLASLRRRVPQLDEALQSLVARQLAHAGEISHLMAAVAAETRLARFLVQLSSRMAERGQSPRRLLLRMNRRDIANHLGLAHETISRAFRLLAEQGWLRVHNREVEILDPEGLRRCARSTRGPAEDEATPGALRRRAA
jgi:CRP/FNR family transcriptional regulator, anaerobic regulatory protein